jgi:hypothetical protein
VSLLIKQANFETQVAYIKRLEFYIISGDYCLRMSLKQGVKRNV